MDFFGLTDKGVVRKQNQDVFLTEHHKDYNSTLLVVCDGMGGAKAGNVASTTALRLFRKHVLQNLDPFIDAKRAARIMKDAVKSVNSFLYEKSCTDEACSGMGTTLVAALVTGFGTAVLNVGDSRAYHISRRGITQITKDHSVVEDLIDRGDITRLEAMRHPNKNLITRALGTAPEICPDLFFPELQMDEYLLLCSDGLTNLVGNQELLYEVLRCPDIKECCDRLIKLALVRGAPDNITAVLFRK